MIPYEIITECGNRPVNEDCVGVALYDEGSYCFVVADGLGGHGGGEKAAQIAVDTICSEFVNTGFSASFFETAFNLAQKAVLSEQEKLNMSSGMKTTLVILVISDKKAYWAHIGDSRLYIFRNGRVKQHTLDHSIPQMLCISGEINEKDIRYHPDRNRLLRVMGVPGEKVEYEAGKPVRIRRNTAFLLCSDGFWEPCDEKTMEEHLKKSSSLKDWLEGIKKYIIEKADYNQDNFSAIAVFPRG